MTAFAETMGSPEHHEVIVAKEEIATLVEFWRGNEEHFAPAITEGLEYIAAVENVSRMPFVGYIDTPQDLQPLVDGATAALEKMSQQSLEDLKKWFEGNPDKVSFVREGTVIWISDVARAGYDVRPFVNGQVLTEPLDVHWVDEDTEQ